MPQEIIQPWEQQENESEEAYEAWRTYLEMGTDRSHAKVAQRLGKSVALIYRWSTPERHNWSSRLRSWNRYQDREINERTVAGRAEMRERQIKVAQNMQMQAIKALTGMTQKQIEALTPAQVVSLLKASADMETKARAVPQSELDANERYDVPAISIEFLEPKPEKMVPVRLEDGTTGYIPTENVEAFKADYPTAVVIA